MLVKPKFALTYDVYGEAHKLINAKHVWNDDDKDDCNDNDKDYESSSL